MSQFTYIGNELQLFREAENWKSYYGRIVAPFVGHRVLEVGAGLGATTLHLCRGPERAWTCLEPDDMMADDIAHQISEGRLPSGCKLRRGTVADLDAQDSFDTILYVDVLEHIKEDGAEMRRAAEHLAPGGSLIVLAPAHNWLFTPFDESIGHFRRYDRKTLAAAIAPELTCAVLSYLDSAGLLASLANRLLLHSSMPSRRQILFWDRFLVPVSRRADWLLRFKVGKSVLGIWRKSAIQRRAA
jgi:SAM-dependent methyltransferase